MEQVIPPVIADDGFARRFGQAYDIGKKTFRIPERLGAGDDNRPAFGHQLPTGFPDSPVGFRVDPVSVFNDFSGRFFLFFQQGDTEAEGSRGGDRLDGQAFLTGLARKKGARAPPACVRCTTGSPRAARTRVTFIPLPEISRECSSVRLISLMRNASTRNVFCMVGLRQMVSINEVRFPVTPWYRWWNQWIPR